MPDPNVVEVPLALVPCQYHTVPEGGVPDLVIITEVHCGELLVGVVGAFGLDDMVIATLPLVELQQPAEFCALM